MLEYLPSNEDVIAVRCGGRLEHEELEAYMRRFEASLKRRDQTHLYAEVVELSALDTDGLGEILKRSTGYLRKLDRIGRVAVVADQSWVRWAANVESAILPHVSYETFASDERDRALAWVEGKIESPHAPAIRIIETDDPDAFGFALDGAIGRVELDAVARHFLGRLEGRGKVRVLGRIGNVGGFQPSALLGADYFAMKRGFLERLERYALVGGPAWLRTAFNALAPLFKAELRHFEEEEEDEAWAWIGARPVSERTLVD